MSGPPSDRIAPGPRAPAPREPRPDYVRCIAVDHELGITWCGHTVPEAERPGLFENGEFAYAQYVAGGEFMACGRCVDALVSALTMVRYAGGAR